MTDKTEALEGTEFVRSLTEDKCDPALGAKVRAHLVTLGLEPTLQDNYRPEQAYSYLEYGVNNAYFALGIDPNDPSTVDTPRRFAQMFVGELTKGLNYDFFPKCTATPNGSVEVHQAPSTQSKITKLPGERIVTLGAFDEVVQVKNIRITSLCEHHLQTIDGFAHIAYLPRTKVLGLSKFARVAEFFAARPQVQERMTEQIHAALCFILGTPDVAVVVDAVHFCMRARGVRQPESWTQTNKMGGVFLTKPEARKEFLDAIRTH